MRVSDIVTELDKRMGTLRRQAQKAERYRKYKAEMRDIELWKASHRWLELAGEDQLVAGRLDDARERARRRARRVDVKDAHVVAERAELALEERRLVGVQEHVYELDNRLRLGESKIGFERREADELDARIAQRAPRSTRSPSSASAAPRSSRRAQAELAGARAPRSSARPPRSRRARPRPARRARC